ncbi:MAG: PP2C family protein-serine/threonine phosphatase [Phycisphaerales bacterium]
MTSTGAGASGNGSSGTSLRDYWTDGSVARLCASISQLTGIEVELRDERGIVLDPDQDAEFFGGQIKPIPAGSQVYPIAVSGVIIGSVVVGARAGGTHEHSESGATGVQIEQRARELVHHIGELVAQMASETCNDVNELRLRVKEIDVHYQLNALLVTGGRVNQTLELTLEAAIDALGLDAGAIMLLPEDSEGLARTDQEDELERSASIGLSEEWLSSPMPLSNERTIDRASLDGQVIAIEDLHDDEQVIAHDQVISEGVRSFLGAGMIFDGRPIGVIRLYSRSTRRFSGAERRLIRSIGQSAAMAVEQARLIKMKARERRTQRSLKIAATVQQRMLPERLPTIPQLDVAARFRPSFEIAGDFYDVFEVREKIGIMVGDVVGKGVVAGLLMSAARATLRSYAELSDDLSRVMARTNEAIYRDTTISEFATIWYGVFDPSSSMLSYVTAGHEPPILLSPVDDGNGGIWWRHELLRGVGLVAGVQCDEEYEMEHVTLERDQVVIMYTDGMTDAMDFAGNRFKRDQLIHAAVETLNEEPSASAERVIEQIFWHMRQFTGLQPQVDDETIVAMRVR